MRFELLGTGTSQGIPVIGCDCPACISTDPRDQRLRCSALISGFSHQVVIDVGPDFRYQMLRAGVQKVDAVLISHEHNDHVIGLDDLRPLMFKNEKPMPIYAEGRVLDEIRLRFAYAFEEQKYPGAPSFVMNEIGPGDRLVFGEIEIGVVRTMHGRLPILGFVVNKDIAYLTDTNYIPSETKSRLADLRVLVLDMLRSHPHHSHNSFDEAIEMAQEINAASTYLIHLSHLMGPTRRWERNLPPDVYPSYDGLSFEF